MIPIFHGLFENGVFTLDSGEKSKFLQYCRGVKNGEGELIVRKKRKRSTPYHRYFFGVIISMIAKHFSVRPLDAYVMIMQTFRPLVTEDDVLKFVGISKMNTKEMMELGDEIREHFLHEYQLYIPEPNEVDIPPASELESQYS